MKLFQIAEQKRCPSCGKPFKKDEPYPDVENCEACERFGPPKTVKEDFNYETPAKEMWRDLIRDAMKEFDISFDLENDDKVVGRDIKIGKGGDINKFYCELWKAGGDWQNPIAYFRCELKDGYLEEPHHSQYNDPHFVFIPGVDEGNPHLVRTKNGRWSAPDNEDDGDGEPDEKLCWQSLEEYLQSLE